MVKFDPAALQAAAESAARKAEIGSNATDQLAPHGSIIIDGAAADAGAPKIGGQVDDLTTYYMGLELRNPLVASAGPLSQTVDGIKALAHGGVGAIVLFSLFEEQIRHEQARALDQLERVQDSFAEALDFFPTLPSNDTGLTQNYLKLVEQGVKAIDIPLIASINGSTRGEWTNTARQLEEAGAAGIELNIYYVPGDLNTTGRDVVRRHLEILSDVKATVNIPVAVKVSPYFSSFGHFATKLDKAGADAIVMFNRYLQPDIDLDRLQTVSGFQLSTPAEAKLPRSWIAALHGRVSASLAATTGVENVEDVLKYLLAGADVVMTTSALVRHGASYAGQLVDGVASWLKRNAITLNKIRGMLAIPPEADPAVYARNGYLSGLERAKVTYAR